MTEGNQFRFNFVLKILELTVGLSYPIRIVFALGHYTLVLEFCLLGFRETGCS